MGSGPQDNDDARLDDQFAHPDVPVSADDDTTTLPPVEPTETEEPVEASAPNEAETHNGDDAYDNDTGDDQTVDAPPTPSHGVTVDGVDLDAPRTHPGLPARGNATVHADRDTFTEAPAEVAAITMSIPVLHAIEEDTRRAPARRWPWIVTTGVLFGALLGCIYLSWQLRENSDAWQTRAVELTEINYDLGRQVATEKDTVVQRDNQITLLGEQLAASNQRVTDIAAEKATFNDEQAYQAQTIAALSEHLQSAQDVASSFRLCVDAQVQLADYLRTAPTDVEPDDPTSPAQGIDPQQLADFEDSVNDLCGAANAAHEQLKRDLTQ